MDLDKQVIDLFDEFWSWRMESSPEFATFCGFHEHDDKLEPYTLDAIKQRKVLLQKFLDKAEDLMPHSNVKAKYEEHLEILVAELNVFLKGYKVKGYYFPLNYLEGPHIEFERLISAMKFNTIEDYKKLLARFSALQVQINQIIEIMKAGIKENLTYHIVSVARVPEQLKLLDQLHFLDKNPEECVFYKPFINFPDSIPDNEKQSLRHLAVESIAQNVVPSFLALKEFLEQEYIPQVRLDPGISALPGGNDFYQLCLDFHLGFHISPKEVHEMGLTEVARISKEMKKVIESLGHANMAIKEFTEQLRNDEKFFFEKPEDIIEAYKDLVFNKISPKLGNLFKNIPQDKVIIEPFPASMSEGPMAYYLAGTADGVRPGVFYVNSKDLKSAPKYQMTALALHEAVPGHHLQAAYNFSTKGLPNFRKYMEDRKYSEAPTRFPLHTAYCEGWGLYSEYLGIELGLYENKYDYFGYLSQEIFRAARFVVDTGIHAFEWPEEKAVAYMIENSASSKREIENEVKRYITWPGQACAYKVGEMKIKSLRKMAEDKLGSKISVQDFHEVVLNNYGPLDVLEQKILELIKAKL